MQADILSGMTVIEVATYIPAPACTQALADLGARVIKVERPGGDPLRHSEPLTPAGENPIFLALNRNKELITLDLKTTDGVATLRDLATGADVLVDGFRPGVLERLGAGPTALRALNPRLIYCALSGYGADGPLRDVAGHDINFVAQTGFLDLTRAGGEPAMPGTQLADMTGGLTAVTAIMAALYARERSGEGCILDVALGDAVLWLMTPWLATQRSGIDVRPSAGQPFAGIYPCYRLYATADERYLAVAALEPHFWARFCDVIARPDLIPIQYDPAQRAELHQTVATIIAGEPLAVWAERFRTVDACVTPVYTLAEVVAMEQHLARGMLPAEHLGTPLPIAKRIAE